MYHHSPTSNHKLDGSMSNNQGDVTVFKLWLIRKCTDCEWQGTVGNSIAIHTEAEPRPRLPGSSFSENIVAQAQKCFKRDQ